MPVDGLVDAAAPDAGPPEDAALRPEPDLGPCGASRLTHDVSSREVTIADMTCDDRMEVVTLQELERGPGGTGNGTAVRVLGAEADGTLAVRGEQALDGTPNGVAAGDFDGDGVRDLIVVVNESLWRVPGRCDGSLGAPVRVRVAGRIETYHLRAAGDLDADGRDDFVNFRRDTVTGRTDAVVALLGTAGELAATRATPVDLEQVTELLVGDLDGDAQTDVLVLVADTPGAHLEVLLGRGDGTFDAPISTDLTEFHPWLTLADVDEDRDDDVLVSLGSVHLMRSDGRGGLGAPEPLHETWPYPAGPCVGADLDGDGRLDLACMTAGELVFLRGLGEARFGPRVRLRGPASDMPSTMLLEAADLLGDARPELLVLHGCEVPGAPDCSSVAEIWGHPQACPLPDTAYPRTGASVHACGAGEDFSELAFGLDATGQPGAVYVGDFDGDAARDVALAEPERITWLRGTASGALVPAGTVAHVIPPDGLAELVALDWDGDGIDELHDCRGVCNVIRLDRGDVVAGPVPIFIAGPLFAGDLDGDGALDLAGARTDGSGVVVIPHDRPIAWPVPVTIPTRGVGLHGATDVDGDGTSDLVIGTSPPIGMGSTACHVFFGPFSERGAASVGPEVPCAASPLGLVDLDGDGDSDAVEGALAIFIHENVGPSFTPRAVLRPLEGWRGLRAARLGGGGVDLVLGLDANGVEVLAGAPGALGPRDERPRRRASARIDVTSARVADMDGDGVDEILATGLVGEQPALHVLRACP